MTKLLALIPALLSLAAFAAEHQSPAGAPSEVPMATSSRAALPTAAPPRTFRAPGLAAPQALALDENQAKASGRSLFPGGPAWVATVRPAPAPYRVATWRAIDGGHVARFRVSATAAQGLRVRLDLGTVPGSFDVRVAGNDGRVFSMNVDPRLGNEAWTPWTDGDTQVVEVFSAVRPSADALSVGALLNFDAPEDLAKAAASCTLSTFCSTSDSALDNAVAVAKRSVMRISGVMGGGGFVCSATLINSPRFPAALILTANHCVSTAQVAGSLTTRWFYETTGCGETTVNPVFEQVAGGAQLVFTNFHVDSTLLQLNNPPPAGAVYVGYNTNRLVGTSVPVVSLSHPDGDAQRLALGTMVGEIRTGTADKGQFPQDMYFVNFSRGATQGGSSGSGLFTLNAGGELELRGVLFGGSGGDPCGVKDGVYGRSDIFGANISPYIAQPVVPADDAPNQASQLMAMPLDPVADQALNLRSTPLAHLNKVITAGDVDVYRFVLTTQSVVKVWTEGGEDLVGSILNGQGNGVRANDDAERGKLDFGLTRLLGAGTYYVQVAHFDAQGVAGYNLRMEAYNVTDNYTDLWWNAAESGWGININHQGNTLFATLFNYDTDGTPMWLVMSGGVRQPDGTYLGDLYRTTGPAFNAAWAPSQVTPVGTMRIAFGLPTEATLTYTVNGVPVTKPITRQPFGTAPTCEWSGFDRSWAFNMTDLWYNAAEPGWGINIAHKGSIAFATIFTYGANGKATWFVMSNGTEGTDDAFTGTLYRTAGAPFNGTWRAATPTAVGTLTVTFTSGNAATLTYTVDGVSVSKSITRQVFSQPKTECRAN